MGGVMTMDNGLELRSMVMQGCMAPADFRQSGKKGHYSQLSLKSEKCLKYMASVVKVYSH